MQKAAKAGRTKQHDKAGETRAVAATIRWAQVLPVDFDGDDTSLTQAQLAVLK